MFGRLVRAGAAAGLALIFLEAAYAVLRPTPALDDFDPSGEFGDPSLPTLKVAVLGDSSVTAPGVAGAHEIWVSMICQRLAANRHVILQSFAIGGSMAHNVLADQVDAAIAFSPDVVFVSVGANDVIKGVPAGVFERNLDEVIGKLAGSGATVVQSGVGIMGAIPRLYPPLSALISRRARRFDRIHWKVARSHDTSVVDQWSDDPRVWNTDRSLWAADFFHVSAAGHARWADTAWRTIGPLLDDATDSR